MSIDPKSLLKDPGLWREAALIGGEWVADTGNGYTELHNPATGEVIAKLARCKEAEANRAIEEADKVFRSWKKATAKVRAKAVHKWWELIIEHKEDLATIITLEEGKPLAEARGEIDYAAGFVEWFSEEAKRVRGDVIAAPRESARIVTLKQPVGVCAAITPWNFPAAMITRKAAPALAAGCTMVVKPAGQTPMTALALGELALRAGLPAGAYSVLTGQDTRIIGGVLTSHEKVRKVTFTGSTEVGRVLLQQSASTVKKCSMELGGNAPCIVFDDADLDAAVEGILVAKFRNTGQSCIAANRVMVQDGVYDELSKRLAERVQKLKVGNGLEEGTQIGPMIDVKAVEKVSEHVANAVEGGAKVLAGGKRHELGGCFYEPTVLTDVKPDMTVAIEETFGPVMPLVRFHEDEEAIAMANDTIFGLASYIFSRDAARIWRAAEGIESGMVGINTGLISTEVAPFGGIKQSGLGREGSHVGIDEYLEIKYLCWDGIAPM